MKRYFIGVWNLANCVTFLGVTAAVVGICFAQNAKAAMLLLLLAGVCDMFDGRIARMFPRTEQETKFGIQLDSFADTVSFVIFPAVFLIAQTRTVWTVIIAVFYVIAGVTRLCWFDITTDGHTKYFQGMPVTCAAMWLPLLYCIAALAGFSATVAAAILIFVMGVLFIANIPVKKPGRTGALILLGGAVAMALVLLLT